MEQWLTIGQLVQVTGVPAKRFAITSRWACCPHRIAVRRAAVCLA